MAIRIYLNGTRFTLDAKRGYYYNTTIRKYLHQAIWEFHNGPIPEGMEVHHRDGDKAHNEIGNYELKTPADHRRHHWVVDREQMLALARVNIQKACEAAPEWHHSAAGLAWHSQHGFEVQANLLPSEFACEQCGATYLSLPCGSHRFCSNNCKSNHRRDSGVDNISRACERCGQEFTVNRYSSVRHCSQSCGTSGHRALAGIEWHSRPGRQPRNFNCEQCGAPYSAVWTGRNRFCSVKCKLAAKEKPDGETDPPQAIHGIPGQRERNFG
jgi:HNH endonuclease